MAKTAGSLFGSPRTSPRGDPQLIQQIMSQHRSSGRSQLVTAFTDPHNPFDRAPSKCIINMEDVRADATRAGARTRTQGFIPVDANAVIMESPKRFTPYRYSEVDFRPAKRTPDMTPSSGAAGMHSPRSTEALENYLNDMKLRRSTRRMVDSTPSPQLLKLNSQQHHLPCDRPHRSERLERSRSLSVQRNAESDQEDSYGFSRKRRVGTPSSRDFLAHPEPVAVGLISPPSARRTRKVSDARFEELIAYIKETREQKRQDYLNMQAKGLSSAALRNHIEVA